MTFTRQNLLKYDVEITLVRQTNMNDCGPACLRMICTCLCLENVLPDEQINTYITPRGISILTLIEIARALGLDCVAKQGTFKEFRVEAELPCIAFWHNTHYVVVYEITATTVKIADPATGMQTLSFDQFQHHWQMNPEEEGIAIFCKKSNGSDR